MLLVLSASITHWGIGIQLEEKPHLVRVPRVESDSTESAINETSSQERPETAGKGTVSHGEIKDKKGIPVKIMALILAAIVIGAGGTYLWAEYVRHWSAADIEEQIISDPTEATPGFRHNLAGRTVTVEGKVDTIETHETTLGDLSLIYTTSSEYIALVVWGDVPYEVGKKIEMRVQFEWAICNNETHVYSPQIAFPWQVLPAISMVLDAVSAVRGLVLVPEDIDSDTVRLEVFDQYPALSLSDLNCSLRVGTSSYTIEYIQSLGFWNFGREIDSISNLSQGVSVNDLVDFVDLDHDGWSTAGDYFELSGIERPEEDSGMRTYMLCLGLTNITDPEDEGDTFVGSSHMVITNRGLLRYTGGEQYVPYARGSASVNGNEVTVTCDRLMKQVSWDDIEIQLTDATNYVSWYPSADGLDGESSATQSLGSAMLGVAEATCTVTDLAGNGYLDEGDYFVITAPSGFTISPYLYYSALLLYEPMHVRMFAAEFSP